MKVSQSPGLGLDDADPLDNEQPRAARRVGVITSAAEVPPRGRRRVLHRAPAAPTRRAHGPAGWEAAAGRAPGRLPGPAGGRRSP